MVMNRPNDSTEHVEQELRSAYLCGCRLLQWMDGRLPVDRKSCMMRGMEQADWYNACSLMVSAGVIDSRLALLVSMPEAMTQLRLYFDTQLLGVKINSGVSQSPPADDNEDNFRAGPQIELGQVSSVICCN